jgi:hypothetical protein
MTYEELADFIEHRMSMSHIYQPLLIRTLIDAGGLITDCLVPSVSERVSGREWHELESRRGQSISTKAHR